MSINPAPPVVLVLAGLDPSGGAGLAADLQTLNALNCHATPVATALTVQDTLNARRVDALPPDRLLEQAQTVIRDIMPAAIKIGLCADVDTVQALARIIDLARDRKPDIRVVLDPVLSAGGGMALTPPALPAALGETLARRVDLITPNATEAQTLGGVAHLLALGAKAILLTRGDNPQPVIRNSLYQTGQPPRHFDWPRIAGQFRGTGCTLASACAAGLAHGLTLTAACQQAQQFVAHSVAKAYTVGHGQAIPHRYRPWTPH